MSELRAAVKLNPSITLVITEDEARMLHKIAEWNAGDVFDGIQKSVSKSETDKFRQTFIGFIEGLRSSVGQSIGKIDRAMEALK
jgi:hypothetical protein